MKFLSGLGTKFISMLGGTVNGVLGTTVSLLGNGVKTAVQFHQEGIALGRDLGLTLSQANAYTKTLTESTAELAHKYGVSADAIKEVQRGVSEATNRQMILNESQREGFVQANKFMGAQTVNKFTAEIMNSMGGQVEAVNAALAKTYATSMKNGLNAKKFSQQIADNLTMVNRLSFRDGVNGMMRMAAYAEKVGLDIKSVEKVADNFYEFDKAIEHSAHLQMLGGTIGAQFGNPLTNMYEAMYDPEALSHRMADAMKGMGTFNKNTGQAEIGAFNKIFLENILRNLVLIIMMF